MAESTLSYAYSDLVGEVGLFMGFGRGAALGDQAWIPYQQAVLDSIVKSGLRQFYFPPPVMGQESSYDWSFLKPVLTVDFPQGGSTIPLPDDFGGFEGELTLVAANAQVAWPVQLYNEGQIRQKYAELPQSTGRPLMAAIQPLRGTGPTQGQRMQLILWPLADQDYKLQFAYYILPEYLNGAAPYAYGGMAHVETIIESCLAIAEQRLDDSSTVHSAKFNERLQASIGLDRRNKAQTLGYNGDRSDRQHLNRQSLHWLNLVTVHGNQY